MRGLALALIALGAGAFACGDVDPVWQLDHDRIVAVRATPPHIPAGATSVIDALLAHKGAQTDVEFPTLAIASPTAPMQLAGAVAPDGTVTAPGSDVLDAVRAQEMLAPGAPVPLDVALTFGSDYGSGSAGGSDGPRVAIKTVYLGDSSDNPTITGVTVDGADPGDGSAELVIPFDTDVPLSVDADPDTDSVNWLTSCGTMHDDDEIRAFVHVLPDDPQSGELAVVRRDGSGGVAWQTWPIRSTGSGSGSGSTSP